MRRIWMGVLAGALGCGLARAQGPEPSPSPAPAAKPFKLDTASWKGELAEIGPLDRIEVRNDYGDIRARYGGPGRVELLAAIQRLGAGPDAGLNVERRGRVLVVQAVLPPGVRPLGEADPAPQALDRIDLTVFVPLNVQLSAATTRGEIEVRRLESDVELSTRLGDIYVSTNGAVQARSAGGSVQVYLGKHTGEGPLLVQTQTGAIKVSVPGTANLAMAAESFGEVTSEFPVEQRPSRDPRQHRLTAGVGRPLQDLLLRSGSGRVEIVKAEEVKLISPSPLPSPR